MSSIDKEWVENHIDSNGEVIIPEGIEKIEAEAFKDNKLVRKVVMPNTVTEIGDNAFSGCINLEDIEFSENLKTIGENAFLGSKVNVSNKETAHEIAEKIRDNANDETSYIEDVIKWCDENAERLNLSNSDQSFLCEKATKYLMENKVKRRWSEEEAKFIVHFLSKKTVDALKLDKNVNIEVIDEKQYVERYGESRIVGGECTSTIGSDLFDIKYTPHVINDLMSNDKESFLRGLQTIYHELQHVNQNKSIVNEMREDGSIIPKNKTRYLSALETIVARADRNFYKEHYKYLLKENDANKNGLVSAIKALQQYAPSLQRQYDMSKIISEIEQYDKNYYEAVTSNTNGQYDLKREIDKRASDYIQQNPGLVEQFPILQVGFHKDGTKKDIIELIEDRNDMINNGEKIEKVNELYEIIANHRNVLNGGLRGTNAEMAALKSYIEQTGTEDEFIYSLLSYRVENRTKATPEAKKAYMEQVYTNAAKTRQEREEKEIEYEESESIKDEIGDEFKPKTEQQQQEERQVESMWQNRFQSWDRDTAILPDGAKKKSEAVKVMQDIQRQQDKEKQNQEQLDNQNNDQR